jgi:hypothetical protein
MQRALCFVVLAAIALAQDPPAGLDAAADGWPTEAQYEGAKANLKALLQHVLADPTHLPAEVLTGTEWTWPSLKPQVVGPRFMEHGEEATLGGIADAMAQLLAPLMRDQPLRTEVKVHEVHPGTAGSFAVQARLQAFAHRGAAGLQRNAHWRVYFQRKAEALVIQRIESSSVRWVSLREPLLQDRTPELLGTDPLFEEVVIPGAVDAHGRLQALGELPFFGHNGLAVGDVNGDGLDDLYVCMPNGIPNRLYIQQPDGSAKECAAEYGVDWLDDTKSAIIADFDNDGDADLALALGPTILVMRQQEGRFVPSNGLRSATTASFYSLACADYDGDGDLDLFGVRYVKTRYGENVPQPLHDARNGPTNHLLRNDGDKGWTDVTASSGLGSDNARFSLAAAFSDLDDDGDPDLVIANDFGTKQLWQNDGGHFSEIASAAGVEDRGAGMGVAIGDANNDGRLDLYFSNMFSAAGRRIAFQDQFQRNEAAGPRAALQNLSFGNSLLLNKGGMKFEDVSRSSETYFGRWAWGALFADYDNDGHEDLHVPNGFVTSPLEDDL